MYHYFKQTVINVTEIPDGTPKMYPLFQSNVATLNSNV